MIRFLVISDIHATKSKGPDTSNGSFVYLDNPSRSSKNDPLLSLPQYIQEQTLGPFDALLCPGDIADQADVSVLRNLWDEVTNLAKSLNTPLLAATGNHDVESRANEKKIVDQTLRDLDHYPLNTIPEIHRYWAESWYRHSYSNFHLLGLNTCGWHQYGVQDDEEHFTKEHERGAISERTLRKIEESIKDFNDGKPCILLCHHHPIKHSFHNLGEYDEIRRGSDLLDLLSHASSIPWLVVHGHKHHALLRYADGGSGAPVIFSAGSLSKCLTPRYNNRLSNHFHIVELLDWNAGKLQGQVYSYMWIPETGWLPSTDHMSLPYQARFGCRTSVSDLADSFQALMVGKSTLSIKDIESTSPSSLYLLPQDQAKLDSELERRSLMWAYSGKPPKRNALARVS